MPNREKCDVGALCKDRGCPVHDPDPTPPQGGGGDNSFVPKMTIPEGITVSSNDGTLPPTEGWEERFDNRFNLICSLNCQACKNTNTHNKSIKSFIRTEIQKAREEVVRDFKKMFWDEFKGVGELWFPYKDEKEAEEAVQSYWNFMTENYAKSKGIEI